jgi:rod shape-determining protein MreC
MQRPGNLKLFRRGLPAEFALVALIGVALAFLVLDANTKLLNPVRQAIALGLYPFQRLVLAPRDALITINDLLNVAATAKAEDEAAQKQRIELAQLATHAAQLTTENAQLKRLLGVFDKLVDQPSVVVEVLYEPANAFSRRLVFNKGSGNGIAPGMPVIDEGGVVGQVIRVTPLTSEAAVLTDELVSIPVQLLRNGLRLIAFGSTSPGKVEVRYFASDADIREGDLLVTSGVGGVFPPGLPVAKVDRVERDSTSGFARAEAQPSAHPERYRHFLVLQVPVDGNETPVSRSPSPSSPNATRVEVDRASSRNK